MLDTLEYINNWEQNLIDGKISKEDFLTPNTAEGLRVTLQSTIDSCNYLLNECGFHYVLTSKMNQDALEVINIICPCFLIYVIYIFI